MPEAMPAVMGIWGSVGESGTASVPPAEMDERFDFISCFHVLEHIADEKAALGELFRVMRKGGLALLQVVEHLVREASRIPNREGGIGGYHLVIQPHQMDVLEQAIGDVKEEKDVQ